MPWNPKDYPPNWDEIRSRIIARAGNRCEGSPKYPDCRLLNGSIILREKGGKVRDASLQELDMIYAKVKRGVCNLAGSIKFHGFTRVVLTVSHVNHDKENHDVKDEDLKLNCQACHLSRDLAHHVENRKYGRNHKKANLKLDL